MPMRYRAAMDVDADIVTFIASDLRTGCMYNYFETDKGVAASILGDTSYSIRLKDGFYATDLTEEEALNLLVHGE